MSANLQNTMYAGDARGVATRRVALCAFVIALLLPFVAKPVHMDDPMYIWTARQIAHSPLNFYGFDVNWDGRMQPAWAVNKNPPLSSYFIALVNVVAGERPVVLHAAFLIPAVLLAIAVFELARSWCGHPMLAAALAVLSPALLVSATTLMSDVLMLCLWMWAMVFWGRGLRTNSWPLLALASMLSGFAILTKFSALCLLPLLGAWMLMERGKKWRILFLLMPLLMLVAYEAWTARMYGNGHLALSMSSSSEFRRIAGTDLWIKLFVGLSFTGACAAGVLFFCPWLWRGRGRVILIAAAAVIAIVLGLVKPAAVTDGESSSPDWFIIIQVSLWVTSAIGLMMLAARDALHRRDVASIILLLWISCVFSFAVFLNWSINARSLLPLVPAAAILLVRVLECRSPQMFVYPLRLAVPIVLLGGLSLAVAFADQSLARSAQVAANRIMNESGDAPSRIWFQGHWGFQYAMESHGAKALDTSNFSLTPGDVLVLPRNNSGVLNIPESVSRTKAVLEIPVMPLIATMSRPVGAGFYSDLWGPVPYVFGIPPHERYALIEIVRPIRNRPSN